MEASFAKNEGWFKVLLSLLAKKEEKKDCLSEAPTPPPTLSKNEGLGGGEREGEKEREREGGEREGGERERERAETN